MTDLRKAAEMAAYEVPLHELLEGVPEDARLVIDSEDGMSTRFIPVGHLCKRAAEALRQALEEPANSTTDFVEPKAASQTEQEPVWSAEECARVLKTLRYIQGIAERGEGRAMRDDETLEQFVLGYVKKLEQPEQWDGPTDEEYENFCSLIQREEAKLKERNGG